jgi:hypothetical protein
MQGCRSPVCSFAQGAKFYPQVRSWPQGVKLNPGKWRPSVFSSFLPKRKYVHPWRWTKGWTFTRMDESLLLGDMFTPRVQTSQVGKLASDTHYVMVKIGVSALSPFELSAFCATPLLVTLHRYMVSFLLECTQTKSNLIQSNPQCPICSHLFCVGSFYCIHTYIYECTNLHQ